MDCGWCWWWWWCSVVTTAVGLLATEVVVATLEAAEDDDDVDDGCEPSNKPCISFCDRPDTSRGVVCPFNLLFVVGAL